MIPTDIGDYTQNRMNGIGRVQPSAQTCFYNGYIDFVLREIFKCHRYGNFEKRRLDFFYKFLMFFDKIYHEFFRAKLTIYTDSLSEIFQMTCSCQSSFITRFLQNGSQHMRSTSLAVGSCNMYGFEIVLRIS